MDGNRREKKEVYEISHKDNTQVKSIMEGKPERGRQANYVGYRKKIV